MAAVVLSLFAAAPGAEKPKLIVLDLTAAGIDERVGSALSEAVTAEAANRAVFQVISSKEVQTMLGVERQKQMVGCSEGSSCLTELGGALGARFVMSGSVARLGSSFQLSLQTFDTKTAQPVGRSSRIAKDLGELRGLIPWAVAEATGTPLPPPPSRWLPYSIIAGGGLLAVAGGVVGFNALTREEVISSELSHGKTNPASLRPAAEYATEADIIGRQKAQALIGLTAGAALVALGLYLNPPDLPSAQAGATVALVPSANGVVVVGGF
jgi:TolB-like protein